MTSAGHDVDLRPGWVDDGGSGPPPDGPGGGLLMRVLAGAALVGLVILGAKYLSKSSHTPAPEHPPPAPVEVPPVVVGPDGGTG